MKELKRCDQQGEIDDDDEYVGMIMIFITKQGYNDEGGENKKR